MAFKRRTTKTQFMMARGWAPTATPDKFFQWTRFDAGNNVIGYRFDTDDKETAEWRAIELEWKAFCELHPDDVI